MKEILLKAKKDGPLKRQHPWVFSGAIASQPDDIQDGERVRVCDHQGGPLGIGHFQDGSIRVRVFHFGPEDLPADIWESKFRYALQSRQSMGLSTPGNNCFRLIHAAGDGCPGLVVDIYGDTAVVQCHSWGMYQERQQIADALSAVLGSSLHAVYCKSQNTLPQRFGASADDHYLLGKHSAGMVKENGHSFMIDWQGGQKTGFFLDQRENRQLLARYAEGKTLLNTFAYTGGFSVYALAAGALKVDSVDLSAEAMAITDQNIALNQLPADRHQSHTADVLKFLAADEHTYDIVVVDPPAYAKNYNKRHKAVQGYKRLNIAAMKRLNAGGLLFTFSCSKVVDRKLFQDTIVAAGIEAGRPIQILHQLSQGPDHPVSLFHPEGSYLKGLVLRVGQLR